MSVILEILRRQRVFKRTENPRGYAIPAKGKLIYASEGTQAKVAEVNKADMSVPFIICTAAVDRDRDIVVPKGCIETIAHYMANPRVFFDHQDWPLPVGSARHPATKAFAVNCFDDRVESTCYFHGLTPESLDIFKLCLAGELETASIGFVPLRARKLAREHGDANPQKPGYIFDAWDLMEWSICGVPKNPEATRMRLACTGSDERIESTRVRSALRKYAAKAPVWSNGVTFMEIKNVVRVSFPKDKFKSAGDCELWLTTRKLDTSMLEEGEQTRTFVQKSGVKVPTESKDVDGAIVTTLKKSAKKESSVDDIVNKLKEKGFVVLDTKSLTADAIKMLESFTGKAKKKKSDDDDQELITLDGGPDEMLTSNVPFGAESLMAHHSAMHSAYKDLSARLPKMEPDSQAREHVSAQLERLMEMMDETRLLAEEHYPDSELSFKDVDGEEELDEDTEDEDEDSEIFEDEDEDEDDIIEEDEDEEDDEEVA